MLHRAVLTLALFFSFACTAGVIEPALSPYEGPIDGAAIVQGQTADCFLISVLRQLADKDVHFVRDAIAQSSPTSWQVRLYVDGAPRTFDVDEHDLDATYALTTDGSLWPNIIEAAMQHAGISLQYGDASLAMSMLTGKPTRVQRIDASTIARAALHAEAGLPSVVCSTHETQMFTPFHCFGLHTRDGALLLEDPMAQGDERYQLVTPAALQAHFACTIHMGY